MDADALHAAVLRESVRLVAASRPVGVDVSGVGEVIGELAGADGRTGAERIWRAAVVALLGARHALLGSVPGADELDGRATAAAAFLEPLRLARARPDVVVVEAADGALAVQAPTAVHRELATACSGASEPDWKESVRRWATSLPASEAVDELQLCGVPALRIGPRRVTPAPTPLKLPAPVDPAGARVFELGGLWAAPFATRLLADLGAAVVKVEAPMRPDGTRRGDPRWFSALNAGKQSWWLDLRETRGQREFLAALDPRTVVIENLTGPVLGRLGIPPEAILARGAALVRMPATAARPHYRALGPTLELAAGLGRLLAGELAPAPVPFTDLLSGARAALEAVLALGAGPRLRVVGQLEQVAHTLDLGGARSRRRAGVVT